MSQRFIKSTIWDNEEFLEASVQQKLLFFFVLQKCNNIGVYSIANRAASFFCGFEVTDDLIASLPCDIEKLSKGVYWMPKFVMHQYGTLSESCMPHRRYIADLKKMGLLERVLKGYAKGIETLEDKEKEKDKDKDKEKDKDKDKDKEKDSYTCISFKENKEEESTVLCPFEIVNIEPNAQLSILPAQAALERPIISTLPDVLPTRKRGLKPLTEPNDAEFAEWWNAYPRKDAEEEKTDPPVDPDFGTNETPQGDIEKPKQRSKDPAHEEVAEYCKELGISDAMRDDFFSYYDMRGWKTNRGVKVAKWKIALKRWANRDLEGANARFV